MIEDFNKSLCKLQRYCEEEDFKGWDPYDGLNSKLLKFIPFSESNFFRLVWIQAFKKSPINLRSLLFVEKDHNPKGVALFLTAYCNLYRTTNNQEYIQKIHYLADKLIQLKTDGYSGACWGYNFPWKTRRGFLAKGTPTIVTTSFAAYALIDAYECAQFQKYLEVALSSCNFVIDDLETTERGEGYLFSYAPLNRNCVYNASLLGSRLLARAYSYSKSEILLNAARASVVAAIDAQRNDGAWVYGELPFQKWVDSFHTGYNLECISEYQKYSDDSSFSDNIAHGFNYYINNFFLDDGIPKYYDKKTYPIDIHAPAQFIPTLYRLNQLNKHKTLADKVIARTINKMQNSNKGYFYYQQRKRFMCKIPYMRWAQAWMLYAFSFYFLNEHENKEKNVPYEL